MSQSFKFGFGDEDSEEDYISIDNVQQDIKSRKGEEFDSSKAPHTLNLDDILSALPSNIQYNVIQRQPFPNETISFVRRELFDIRAQSMAEDTNLDEPLDAGLSPHDIKPNVYEGGFKTWECSIDLADYLLSEASGLGQPSQNPCTVIELGAGTALPTLVLFHGLLTAPLSPQPPRQTVIIADYNSSVLSLATIPNLLLTYALTSHIIPPVPGDLEITPSLISSFQQALADRNVAIHTIAGSWSSELASMIARPSQSELPDSPNQDVLMLASETIYSPTSLSAFTTTLLEIMQAYEKRGDSVRTLLAAKKVYFGVGGGVDEFLSELWKRGGEGKEVWATEGSGVGRCILEVRRRER